MDYLRPGNLAPTLGRYACLGAGADTVLRKPVSVAAVARAVADATAMTRKDLATRITA